MSHAVTFCVSGIRSILSAYILVTHDALIKLALFMQLVYRCLCRPQLLGHSGTPGGFFYKIHISF